MVVSHKDAVDRLLFWTIAVASAGFVFILGMAAFFDHSIIVLHIFQALQYLVIVALAARGNRLGYFMAIAVGAFWDYLVLFVNGFVASGWAIADGDHPLRNPDQP